MQIGKLNIVTDGCWGSTGKGAITSYLAWKHKPQIISTTNMANAGHTAVDADGKVFVAKVLPSGAVLNKWYDYQPTIFVGATAAFDLHQLQKEIQECGLPNERIFIHPRAGVITQVHKDLESGNTNSSTKHIASTMQGCGTFLADKVLRKPELKLARDYEELAPYIKEEMPHLWLHDQLDKGHTILHEGSQGFSLDISHGSHYPQCTSRSTTATQNVTDLGLNHTQIGDIYLVIRPYPIRVGNVIEDGKQLGYSGDCYHDNQETTWEAIMESAGAPPDIKAKELTTVTKRLRRVFTFSKTQYEQAVRVNGATKIALNFANYLDWTCYDSLNNALDDKARFNMLPDKVKEFVHMLEDVVNVKVSLIGTGPKITNILEI
jgi:adenylosuccinate synthase